MALLKELKWAIINQIMDNPKWEKKKVKFLATVKGRIGFRGYTTEYLVSESEGALTLGATHINNNGEIVLTSTVYISWDKYYESPEIMVQKVDRRR